MALDFGVAVVFALSMWVALSMWQRYYSVMDGIFVFGQATPAPGVPVVQHAPLRTATPQSRDKTPRKRNRK